MVLIIANCLWISCNQEEQISPEVGENWLIIIDSAASNTPDLDWQKYYEMLPIVISASY